MNKEFTEKMKRICKDTINDVESFLKDKAVEAHLFGSMAKGTNDALSDIDIWVTFDDSKIKEALANRMLWYKKFGEIILIHEMQNNFPLNGVQTAVLYKIEGELIRVDFYLCPFSSSRVVPNSKFLFEYKKIKTGDMIYETKTTPRDFSDRITFLISMCFIGIKKAVRGDKSFMDFLVNQIEKHPELRVQISNIPDKFTFEFIINVLSALYTVSDPKQKFSIDEINPFLSKVEALDR